MISNYAYGSRLVLYGPTVFTIASTRVESASQRLNIEEAPPPSFKGTYKFLKNIKIAAVLVAIFYYLVILY